MRCCVVCACNHLFLSFVPLCLSFPCLPHLGEPFLLFTLFFFYFLLERGPIGRRLLSRRLVRRRRWSLKGNLCSACVFTCACVWSWSRLVLVSFGPGPVWSWSRLVLVPFGLGLVWSWSRLVLVFVVFLVIVVFVVFLVIVVFVVFLVIVVFVVLPFSCCGAFHVALLFPCCVAFSMLRCFFHVALLAFSMLPCL